MSRYHACRIKRWAMVQTASTSEADQPHVPGATAVRVVGVLLFLLGGWKLYTAFNVVQAFQRTSNADARVFTFTVMLLAGLGLLTAIAGILLVRRVRAGRVFGLVVCSIALANQLLSFGSTLTVLYVIAPSPTRSVGMVFWATNAVSIVLYLVSIIVIARWHPPLEKEQLGRIFD
jgi:hypothetical protein